MKTVLSSTSRIRKAIYHYDSYLLLFGNKKLQSLEISCK